MKKLPDIIKRRNENYLIYRQNLDVSFWSTTDDESNYISNFAYPIISKNRDMIAKSLKENGVECRPLLSGSLARQPYWFEKFGETPLNNCDFIHNYGMYLPNNHEMTTDDIKYICTIINRFK